MASELLCFTAKESASSIKLTKHGSPYSTELVYSYDGINWIDYEIDQVIALDNIGDKVYLRAKTQNINFSYDNINNYYFVMTGKIAAKGNIMFLLDSTGERDNVTNYTFTFLFEDCTSLTTAPEMPAVRIGKGSYWGTYIRCTSLEKGPSILPALNVEKFSYRNMFQDCIKLVESPRLMFTTFTDDRSGNEIENMFYRCNKLEKITVKFTKWRKSSYIQEYHTLNWVYGVSSNGNFYCPKELPIEFSENGIPPGWRVNPVQKIYINKQPVIKPYLNGKIGKIYVGTRRVY